MRDRGWLRCENHCGFLQGSAGRYHSRILMDCVPPSPVDTANRHPRWWSIPETNDRSARAICAVPPPRPRTVRLFAPNQPCRALLRPPAFDTGLNTRRGLRIRHSCFSRLSHIVGFWARARRSASARRQYCASHASFARHDYSSPRSRPRAARAPPVER